jgi:L-gulonate 5-dehydrogenase
MRALVTTGPRVMEVEEVPDPGSPDRGHVLLDVEAVGICGADYILYRGTHPDSRLPLVQGHEFCGVVSALGPGCTSRYRVGSRVVVDPRVTCGRCYACSLGRSNCCAALGVFGVHRPGGLQERLVVPERLCHPIGALPAEVAALGEPMSVAVKGVTRAGVTDSDRVLVLGAGPMGQMAILAACSRGARVAAVDFVAERLTLARAVGAEVGCTPGDDLPGRLEDWTGGGGPTVVIEASGASEAIRAAVEVVAPRGRIVLTGVSAPSVWLPIRAVTRKEISVYGSRTGNGAFGEAVRLLSEHRIDVRALITHRVRFEQVSAAIELALLHPDQVEKIVVLRHP